MSGLVTLDDNIVEFNDPRLGIDPKGLQKWAQEVQETADKTDRLAKVTFEIRVLKWITPEVTESERVEEGKTITTTSVVTENVIFAESEMELDKDSNFKEYDFQEEVEVVKEILDNATSYGVVFITKAYQSNDTLVATVTRKFGRLDLSELKKAWEALNKPIQAPPITVNVEGHPLTIPSRPIPRVMPLIDPEVEFKKLFDSLEMV